MFGSIALFLGWCIVGGIAYSFAFTGGLGLINQASAARHRGATLSLLYVIAYAFQAGTAIGVGALATGNGLNAAVGIAALTLIGLSAVLFLLLILEGRMQRAVPSRSRV